MKENKMWKKFGNEQRIEDLAEEYHRRYPNLKLDHVKALIIKIISLITNNPFDPYKEKWKQFDDANIMREVIAREFTSEEREKITESCCDIYFLSRGDERDIEHCFKNAKPQLTQENPVDYQELCKQITKEQVAIVTSYFFNSLSNADKVLLGRGDNQQNIENRQNSSFVSRVGGGKKSISFAASVVDNEGNPRPKKLTHNFVK